jgi:Carboxylesterase family
MASVYLQNELSVNFFFPLSSCSTWSGKSILLEVALAIRDKREINDPSLIASLKIPGEEGIEGVPPISPSLIAFRDKTLVALNDLWACSTYAFASTLAEHGGRVRYFAFGHEPSYTSKMLGWLRSYHGAELDFISGFPQTAGKPENDEEKHLSAETMRLWIEIVTGKRHALVQDAKLEPGKGYLIVQEEPEKGGYYAAVGAREGVAPAGLGGRLDKLHVDRDWPFFNASTETCLHLKTGPRIDHHCRPFTCHLWEATMKAGLMPIPPKVPEPWLSLFINLYGAIALNFLLSNARYVLPLLAIVVGTIMYPVLKLCVRAAKAGWEGAGDIRKVWEGIRWSSTHGYAQSMYSS